VEIVVSSSIESRGLNFSLKKISDDVVCERDVFVRQSELDAKVARAKQLIEEKKKEKDELEAKVVKI
jgi:hypothetical protein